MEIRVIELLQEIKSILTGKPKQEQWLDINKASKYCGLGVQTLRRNVINEKNPNNKLKASTSTGKLLFKIQDLEDFLNG